ncbi:MAG TPA: hypothetical protein DDZ88_16990, partial [Verrucomicrobiales bacterium]|nr:hypothetical protein [Verrucomicrobiales bacterium]
MAKRTPTKQDISANHGNLPFVAAPAQAGKAPADKLLKAKARKGEPQTAEEEALEALLQEESVAMGDDMVLAQAGAAGERAAAAVVTQGGGAATAGASATGLTVGQMVGIGAGLLAAGAAASSGGGSPAASNPGGDPSDEETLTATKDEGTLTLSNASGDVLLTLDDAEEPTEFLFIINGVVVHRVPFADFVVDKIVLDEVNLFI